MLKFDVKKPIDQLTRIWGTMNGFLLRSSCSRQAPFATFIPERGQSSNGGTHIMFFAATTIAATATLTLATTSTTKQRRHSVHGEPSLIRLLLSPGKFCSNVTAQAVRCGRKKCVEFILWRMRANTEIADYGGFTPLLNTGAF